ncbi:MAG TPA: hypothetical protein PKY59_10465 [Pyrinomonadaceae bacterium]|nr:hypothetical protein [Pyrinomonadaceae bacterium]
MNTNTATKKVTENIEDVKNTAKEKVGQYLETSGEKISNVKEKLSDNLAGAAEKLHKNSDSAQDYLNKKADQFNEIAHEKIEKANQFGHRAAATLEGSSDYVKNFDFAEAGNKIKTTVKQKPQIGIALAGIFGLLIGLLVGRKTS